MIIRDDDDMVLAIRMTPDRDEVAAGVCNDSPLRIGRSPLAFCTAAEYTFNVK